MTCRADSCTAAPNQGIPGLSFLKPCPIPTSNTTNPTIIDAKIARRNPTGRHIVVEVLDKGAVAGDCVCFDSDEKY